jgi:hypothetical protein
MTGDFTGNSRAAFPYILAAKHDQHIFSPECTPEGFTLSDPDHLNGGQIVNLYKHWVARQKKGLAPFIILNAGPNHAVKQEKSVRSKGKKKMEWVDVDSSEEDEEQRNREDNLGDEQMLPLKIGPPRKKSAVMPAPTQEPSQVAGPSTQRELATLAGPSTLHRPPTLSEPTPPPAKVEQKKMAANRKKVEATVDHDHDEVDGPTNKRTS